ncbi:MAG: hypothetical protein MZV70_54370 [Desulfobacterales bacterium]|nr:hypothetical protein [Desulfobacterales bacterium]
MFAIPAIGSDIAAGAPLTDVVKDAASSFAMGAALQKSGPPKPEVVTGRAPEPAQLVLPGEGMVELAMQRKAEADVTDLLQPSGGPKTTGQMELGIEKLPKLPDVTVPKDKLDIRPPEEPEFVKTRPRKNFPSYVSEESVPDMSFLVSANTTDEYVEYVKTHAMTSDKATNAEIGINVARDIINLKDPVDGSTTRHIAKNARSMLRNIVSLFSGGRGERAKDIVDISNFLLELPESGREINITPMLDEQAGRPFAGFHRPGTGEIYWDPTLSGLTSIEQAETLVY